MAGAGDGLGGIVLGTGFGAPLGVALKAPRIGPLRGSVFVVVFNFGLEENILPVDAGQTGLRIGNHRTNL